MSTVIQNRDTAVWLLLVTATSITGWLAETERGLRAASIAMLLIASTKIWLIMQNFMELRTAPLAWRLGLGAWLTIVTTIVLSNYWLPLH